MEEPFTFHDLEAKGKTDHTEQWTGAYIRAGENGLYWEITGNRCHEINNNN